MLARIPPLDDLWYPHEDVDGCVLIKRNGLGGVVSEAVEHCSVPKFWVTVTVPVLDVHGIIIAMGLLSIYIPTWKRPHLLDRLLQSIEPQLVPGVDVFVSVNKSDVPYSLPPWVQSRHTRINVGGDANIIAGPSLVSGEYIWVIGDDDHLLPGAVATTLRAIEEKPGIIIHPDGKYKLGVADGTLFQNYADFCRAVIEARRPRTVTAHTLISSNTFIRRNFDSGLAVRRIDTMYGFHYGMLTNMLDMPVKIADQPTMRYDHDASIFLMPQDAIDEHMAAYPQVMYDLYDWLTERIGYKVPYSCWGKGFY